MPHKDENDIYEYFHFFFFSKLKREFFPLFFHFFVVGSQAFDKIYKFLQLPIVNAYYNFF